MADQNPERHPEDYCHRCDGPNISWYTPAGVWNPVMRPVPGEPWKWNEIICPLCFVELAGGGTWALIPMGQDGQPWVSADEHAAIREAGAAEVRAHVEALADQWEVTAREGRPHLGCFDMHRHLAAELRTALNGGK